MDISVLVVDHDVTSLAVVAKILTSWKYKVLTANSAHNALKTLQEFEGFFDLVVMELHISGMNGFEFQKRVTNEFQLPVIIMTADRRQSVMSKSLEIGASLFILKPFSASDFKNIWQYATVARKGNLAPQKIEVVRRESSIVEAPFTEPTIKRKYNKRKICQMNEKEEKSKGNFRVLKKPKVVWTTSLHNKFLLAINLIGNDKAVPKKILEIMNVPNLTRKNIASHLQKYRIFLKKIEEKGLLASLSGRAISSRFAIGFPTSLIKDMQTTTQNFNALVPQYLRTLSHQSRNYIGNTNAHKPFNQVPMHLHDQQASAEPHGSSIRRGQQVSSNSYLTLLQQGQILQNQHADSLNEVRLGKSRIGSNIEGNNFQQKLLGSYANPSYQAYGLMTSSNGLIGGLKHGGDPMYQNYGSLKNPKNNNNFGCNVGNLNMETLSGSNLLGNSNCYPSSNSQMNGGLQMVGNEIQEQINSFGLMNETQDANISVANGNFGSDEGRFDLDKASNVGGDEYVCEIQGGLKNNGNQEASNLGIQQFSQQLDCNFEKNDHQFKDEDEFIHLEDDLSKLLLTKDDMNFLNEIQENPKSASELAISDFSSSCHLVQPLKQQHSSEGDFNVTIPPPKSTSNLPKEGTSSYKNSNELLGDDKIWDWDSFDSFLAENVSPINNSAVEEEWDMELIESLFGNN